MIRTATASDADEIARLHVKTWQAAYRGHMPDAHLGGLDPSKRAAMWSKAIQQADTVVLVAGAGEALVGVCSLLASRDTDAAPHVGEIAAIYVDPSLWRSGIGRSLVDAATAAAFPRHFVELTLWVLTGNVAACAFYESCGFEVDGHTKLDERLGFAIHETRYRRRIVP
ncbi:MAG: GNAT family N-acetyltransferase [Deltaproteobacteria bacterium]|nr:GNAT family N-acetyltransferase [Nannocystaceae bacterium]